MRELKIEWLSDSVDCETCGGNYADGARVWLDGELLLELIPVAHCFDSANWYESDVYKLILEKLGYNVSD
jgi:hypothetical protein